MMVSQSEPALRITGGRRLAGRVEVGGAKNAAMPCLAAALLANSPCTIEHVPDISDVRGFCGILKGLGAEVSHDREAGTVEVSVGSVDSLADSPSAELVAQQRASYLTVGALLGLRGYVSCGPPGGDDLGARGLDIHLAGFRELGAEVVTDDYGTHARAPRGLRGTTLSLRTPSVLATENLLLAAVLATGRTRIENAACEPEIVCLAEMLVAMGARISGAGSPVIEIDGVQALEGATHRLIPDRIEAGTLLIAAAISGGQATLGGVRPEQMEATCAALADVGVSLTASRDTITASASQPLRAIELKTEPHPGFPTDLQAPLTALLTQAHGVSTIDEQLFEDRTQHIEGLRQLGADLDARRKPRLEIRGPSPLVGASVAGRDIRATAALVLAALAAEGESEIRGLDHLDRGYQQFERKLAALGAKIERVV